MGEPRLECFACMRAAPNTCARCTQDAMARRIRGLLLDDLALARRIEERLQRDVKRAEEKTA